jgi:hypothetical protein
MSGGNHMRSAFAIKMLDGLQKKMAGKPHAPVREAYTFEKSEF